MLNPSNIFEWILTILLFVVSLGVLITLHELGHLIVAKIFKVYCMEFSIGFGPAIFKHRGKGKETQFSLRAFPLGGYVSMYGEDTELEEGINIPKNRSLEGIHRFKKALILVAGITMNLILAFALFFASNVFFPLQKASVTMHVIEDSIVYNLGIKNEDKLYFVGPIDSTDNQNDYALKFLDYEYEDKKGTHIGGYYVIDEEVTIGENRFLVTYSPNGAKNDTTFTDAIKLFVEAKTDEEKNLAAEHSKEMVGWFNEGYLPFYVDFASTPYSPSQVESFTLDLRYKAYQKDAEGKVSFSDPIKTSFVVSSVSVSGSPDTYKWANVGLSLKVVKEWLPFWSRIKNVFIDFGSASTAVFQGLISIFKTGIKNLSGIVGIFTTSASVYSSYSFSTYLFFWGLISVNLAIFNLLPFPGLDGWQLLVTIIEGSVNLFKRGKYKKMVKATPEGVVVEDYVEWKIPTKVKAIMSYIGLGLLLTLGIVIIVFDIIRLF